MNFIPDSAYKGGAVLSTVPQDFSQDWLKRIFHTWYVSLLFLCVEAPEA
jgi:hypothetical protein